MGIYDYITEMKLILANLDIGKIDSIIDALEYAKKEGNRIYLMGNGGSATTASHIAGDLNKTCGLRAMALTESPYLITAWANDTHYSGVFLEQLAILMQPEDVVIGISGSGESSNVVNALRGAREGGCKTIALTGFNGGFVKDIADICLIVPSNVMEQIEDIHLMIGHILVTGLKDI